MCPVVWFIFTTLHAWKCLLRLFVCKAITTQPVTGNSNSLYYLYFPIDFMNMDGFYIMFTPKPNKVSEPPLSRVIHQSVKILFRRCHVQTNSDENQFYNANAMCIFSVCLNVDCFFHSSTCQFRSEIANHLSETSVNCVSRCFLGVGHLQPRGWM